MTTLTEYLQVKYGVDTPTTMTYADAKIVGVPYPLRAGWREDYGSIEISERQLELLREATLKRMNAKASGKKKKRKLAKIERAADQIARLDYTRFQSPAQKPSKIKPARLDVASNDFLATFEWRKVRMQAIKKYGARCMCCGATPSDGAVMNVDHIKPRRLFPQLALDIDNLQVLCGECNHGKGNWDMTDWRPNTYSAEIDASADKAMREMLGL